MSDVTTANGAQIDRREKLTYQEFAHEYLYPHKPVIINGALTNWRALSTWTPQYFKTKYGSFRVNIDGKEYTIAEVIDRALASTEENPAPYLRNLIMGNHIPELLQDIYPLLDYFSPNWLDGPFSQGLHSKLHKGSAELYIGGKGGKFPVLHYDSAFTHAFLCQIYGTKEFTAYSQDQTPYLYQKPGLPNVSQLSDIDNPDLQQFPLAAKARQIRFQLTAGELLFIPGGFWHTARMLSPSITVSVNRANASNWSNVTRDLCSKGPVYKKAAAAAYLYSLRVVRTLYGS
jgi:histone arginine demethylase JMJD6